jgi:Spy/CpxP family protein refolding chaperone
MKKRIILVGLMVSSLAFANGFNNNVNNGENQVKNGRGMYLNLTDEQIAKIKELKDAEYKEHKDELYQIEKNNIAIERLLNSENVDYAKVKELVAANEKLKETLRFDSFKTKEAIEDITGHEGNRIGAKRGGAKREDRMDFKRDRNIPQNSREKFGNDKNRGNQNEKGMNKFEKRDNNMRGQERGENRFNLNDETKNLLLDVKEKMLDINNELSNENVNWDKVKTLNSELTPILTELQYKKIVNREERQKQQNDDMRGQNFKREDFRNSNRNR